jgi:hypothetical protein
MAGNNSIGEYPVGYTCCSPGAVKEWCQMRGASEWNERNIKHPTEKGSVPPQHRIRSSLMGLYTRVPMITTVRNPDVS